MATTKFQAGEMFTSLTVPRLGSGETDTDGPQLHPQSGRQLPNRKNPPMTNTTYASGRWISQPAGAA